MFTKNGTDYPLVGGRLSDRSKALLAFEADEKTIFDKVLDGLDNPIAPVDVQGRGALPGGRDHRRRHRHPRFPVPHYSPKDGGRYITPGIVVSKDPETGVPDIGHYRFLILGKDTVSFSAQPFHRFGKNLAKCKKLGIVPKAALVIGVDPMLAYTCQVQVPDTTNDWDVAGGLRGAPVELVTLQDLRHRSAGDRRGRDRVRGRHQQHRDGRPARRIHRLLHAGRRRSRSRAITAITHRKQPIFQGLLTGKPMTENHILKQVPFEASFYARSSASSRPSRRFRCAPRRACRSTS